MARIMLFSLALVMAISGVACAAASQPSTAPATYQVSPAEWEQGFVPLFNGVDLSGWQVMGAPSWSVKDGVVECSGSGGGWLRSDGQYRDFILRMEYKVSPGANSGIFVRSKLEGDPAFTGMEVQVLDDYGQPPDKHSNGALYDAVAPAVNPSRRAGEWNQAEITCWGDQLTVYENGQKLYSVNLTDPALNATQSEERKFPNRAQVGYIGMQNHGAKVWFRNIRVSEGFVPVFDGKDLKGWRTVKPHDTSWSARDGELICDGSSGGYIYNTGRYGDFDLRIQYNISPNGNSGVFFRVGDINDFPGSGAEIQILDSAGSAPGTHISGALYDVLAPSSNPAKPAGEWNQFDISVWKGRLKVVMNEEQVIDVGMDDNAKLKSLPATGYIGLQNHGMRVAFRDIRVKTQWWVPPSGGEWK